MSSPRGIVHLSLFTAALAVAGGLFVLEGTVRAAQSASLTVHDAWVREVAANRKETAVFAVVENESATGRAIVSVTSDAAGKAELHEMKMSGSMMQMRRVKQVTVPAHGKTELKPGGFHIMLFNLKKPPMAGDTVNLTLTFDDGTTVAVAAQVRKQEGMK